MSKSEKEQVLAQLQEQRFLPITPNTYELFQTYSNLIDAHDSNELASLLFYKGEYFFRIGDFNEALNNLSRCLQAPKDIEYKQLDVFSYNITGLIYNYLGQENIALYHFMQGKELCEKLELERDFSVCCVNLGLIYNQLQDYSTALEYLNLAMDHIPANGNAHYNLAVLCEAYRGTIYCKMKDRKNALASYQTLIELKKNNPKIFYDATVLNMNIQLYEFLEDKEFLNKNLQLLLSLLPSTMDFLEASEAYFDAYSYLLSKQLQTESHALLEYIGKHVEHSPLAFMKFHYLNCKVAYTRLFCKRDDYLHACGQLISIRSDYHEEQRCAKLYSLDYSERLHQTKNTSEMYRQKSQIDQMTGLLNKYTTQFFIEEDLATRTSGTQSAMILIDMDHFKQINDTLGHLIGDAFIQQTASTIKSFFKDKALCGRIGGDEFLIYIDNITDRSLVILQSEMLRQEIYRETSERNIAITTQASIGIVFSSEQYYNFETMFSAADKALYEAKLQGRNKIVVAN